MKSYVKFFGLGKMRGRGSEKILMKIEYIILPLPLGQNMDMSDWGPESDSTRKNMSHGLLIFKAYVICKLRLKTGYDRKE